MANMDCSKKRSVRRALAITALVFSVLVSPRLVYAKGDPDEIAAMIAKVSPAVVQVITVRPPGSPDAPKAANVDASATSDRTTTAQGSGYIIDPAGYIGTNRHVVDGAISVFVVTADGVRYPAQIVGMPAQADIALLRVDAGHPLPFVKFGDSDAVRVGQDVVAIGSPFGLDNTATSGIISALNRNIMESPFDDYIQTDAAINHGNSGGPLFNTAGEVIGMNSVIYAPTPGFAGIAFAVPSNSLRFVYGRLMKTGKIDAGMLPIHTQEVTWMLQQALGAPDLQGALVTSVHDDHGKMLQGNVHPGDIVRTFNGAPITDPRNLARKAAVAPGGSKVVLGIFRDGSLSNVEVTVGVWPESKPNVLNDDPHKPIGLELAADKDEHGQPIVTVAAVDAGGSAADSGLEEGDTIVQVQQTAVTDPDQAQHVLQAQSQLKHNFAAVLVRHNKKLSWMSVAVPE